MAYLPVNARSELVIPTNSFDGGVCETTRRFQVASPAFMSPAWRPTRGSGFGAVVDMSTGAGAPPLVEVEWAHADATSSPAASESDRSEAEVMKGSLGITGCESAG